MDNYSITTAGTSHSSDIDHRVKQYMISMGIRLLCLTGVFFTSGVLLWFCIAGAVFIPYIAVIAANSKQGHTKGDFERPNFQIPEITPLKSIRN